MPSQDLIKIEPFEKWMIKHFLMSFGTQTLRFHMFRQPSYMGAVRHIVGTLAGDDERTRYTYMISLFREDMDLALKRIDGRIPLTP